MTDKQTTMLEAMKVAVVREHQLRDAHNDFLKAAGLDLGNEADSGVCDNLGLFVSFLADTEIITGEEISWPVLERFMEQQGAMPELQPF